MIELLKSLKINENKDYKYIVERIDKLKPLAIFHPYKNNGNKFDREEYIENNLLPIYGIKYFGYNFLFDTAENPIPEEILKENKFVFLGLKTNKIIYCEKKTNEDLIESGYFGDNCLLGSGDFKSMSYPNNEVFKEFCGRYYFVINNVDSFEEIAYKVIENKDNFKSEYFIIKHMESKKYPVAKIKITDKKNIVHQLFDAFDYMLEHEGTRDFIILDFVTMKYEYRILVVDGEPVCGAGVIANHTPLDNVNNDKFFNMAIEGGKNIVPESINTKKYEIFANEVCKKLKDTGLLDYTLDLYMDENNDVGIVEINEGATNMGLYGCSLEHYMKAVYNTSIKRF